MKWIDGELVISGKVLALLSAILALICVILVFMLVRDFVQKCRLYSKGGPAAVKTYEKLVGTPKQARPAKITYLYAYSLLSQSKQRLIDKFIKNARKYDGVRVKEGKSAVIFKLHKLSMGKLTIKDDQPITSISVQNMQLIKNGIKLKPVKYPLGNNKELEVCIETFDESYKSFIELEAYLAEQEQ